jgi:DNA-binding transcriptional LysR family regulator
MTQPWNFEGGSAHLSSDWAPRLVHRSTLAVTLTGEGEEVIRSARQLLDATTDVRMRHKRADDAYE